MVYNWFQNSETLISQTNYYLLIKVSSFQTLLNCNVSGTICIKINVFKQINFSWNAFLYLPTYFAVLICIMLVMIISKLPYLMLFFLFIIKTMAQQLC